MRLRLCLLVLLLAVAASAGPVGTLGVGSNSGVNATLFSLDFLDDPTALGVGTFNGTVNNTTNLAFLGCAGGTALLGTPGCLTVNEGVVINQRNPFSAASVPNPQFLTFANAGSGAPHATLLYSVTAVAAGSSTDCAVNPNVECSILTPGGLSPVKISPNGFGGSVVSIGLAGFTTDTGVNPTSANNPWSGGFSATIPNMSPTAILEFFCGVDHICQVGEGNNALLVPSVSGSFFASTAPTVPEPGTITMMLLGAGLIGLAYTRKRSNTR